MTACVNAEPALEVLAAQADVRTSGEGRDGGYRDAAPQVEGLGCRVRIQTGGAANGNACILSRFHCDPLLECRMTWNDPLYLNKARVEIMQYNARGLEKRTCFPCSGRVGVSGGKALDSPLLNIFGSAKKPALGFMYIYFPVSEQGPCRNSAIQRAWARKNARLPQSPSG